MALLYTRKKFEEAKKNEYKRGLIVGTEYLWITVDEAKEKGIALGYEHGQADRNTHYEQIVIPKMKAQMYDDLQKIRELEKHISQLEDRNRQLHYKILKTINKDIQRLETLQIKTKSFKKKKKIENRILKIMMKGE